MKRFVPHTRSKSLGTLYAFLLAIALGMTACDPKPSRETCLRYYESVRRASRGGPRVIEQVVRGASAKATVIDFCLSQPRHQIECALSAASFAELQECENRPKQGIRDSLPAFDDFGDFASGEE